MRLWKNNLNYFNEYLFNTNDDFTLKGGIIKKLYKEQIDYKFFILKGKKKAKQIVDQQFANTTGEKRHTEFSYLIGQ